MAPTATSAGLRESTTGFAELNGDRTTSGLDRAEERRYFDGVGSGRRIVVLGVNSQEQRLAGATDIEELVDGLQWWRAGNLRVVEHTRIGVAEASLTPCQISTE